MSRSRPASNPISFHKHTKQYYVTRGGKRICLGADKEQALIKYHRLELGLESIPQEPAPPVEITIKELANRFIAVQQANWRNPNKAEVSCYGFYRLRHCTSSAMSLVATPHVHRKFMRHSQLQQQVTYTHTPDVEVDTAILKTKEKLLGKEFITSSQERNLEPGQVA